MKKIIRSSILSSAAIAAGLVSSSASAANVYITEWMYNGDEFVEFTNLGSTAVDFTGWSFDDDSRTTGSFDLSGFGLVNSGESVILSEVDAATFISSWGIPGVDVIGGNTHNLSRNDELNLFDNTGALVDRLTFGDVTFPGTIRTQNVSGTPSSLYALGANNVSLWELSVVGDSANSYASSFGYIGNPGSTEFAPVPLPAAAWLLLSGLAGLVGLGRRKPVNG